MSGQQQKPDTRDEEGNDSPSSPSAGGTGNRYYPRVSSDELADLPDTLDEGFDEKDLAIIVGQMEAEHEFAVVQAQRAAEERIRQDAANLAAEQEQLRQDTIKPPPSNGNEKRMDNKAKTDPPRSQTSPAAPQRKSRDTTKPAPSNGPEKRMGPKTMAYPPQPLEPGTHRKSSGTDRQQKGARSAGTVPYEPGAVHIRPGWRSSRRSSFHRNSANQDQEEKASPSDAPVEITQDTKKQGQTEADPPELTVPNGGSETRVSKKASKDVVVDKEGNTLPRGGSVSQLSGSSMEIVVEGNDHHAVAYAVQEPELVQAHEYDLEAKHNEQLRAAETQHKQQLRVRLAVLGVLVLIAIVIPVVLTQVPPPNGGDDNKPFNFTFSTVLVSGLCSPRHLEVWDDFVYVPEGGVGPDPIPSNATESDVCLVSPSFGFDICYGNTGRVQAFSVDSGEVVGAPVVDGLWSSRAIRGRAAAEVYGVGAVRFDSENNMYAVIGLGYVNATEMSLRDGSLVFGSIVTGDGREVIASPWHYEYNFNVNGARIPEANPFDMTIYNNNAFLVDAGGDALYVYQDLNARGGGGRAPSFLPQPSMVILIPKILGIPALEKNPRGGPCNDYEPPRGPPFCGQYTDENGAWLYNANPVPTAVRVQQNKLYVSYLAGALWSSPVSNIWGMELDGEGLPRNDTMTRLLPPDTFWAIIDFHFVSDSLLYVLETNPGGFSIPFDGRLSSVKLYNNGTVSVEILSEAMVRPAGMGVGDGYVYVANNAYNGGNDDCKGEILKGQLPPTPVVQA